MLTSTLCAALSAAGLGIAAMTAYRKRFLAAPRIAAYALLPLGLAMTGIADWISDLVFKPSVWVGFGVLAVSTLLFLLVRTVEQRGEGGTRKERKAAAAAERAALAPQATTPPLGAGRAAERTQPRRKAKGSTGSDEFADIEAILKKHGI
ncbi:hypothetical protein AAHZ94_15140 [Streptomyces sp. HSW2009]|uniref:hypothetical protein n=1 Tax=Streptomyces sp. HSW2009 TaxID=3142890 RepID=UPI0032EE3BF9